MSDLSLRCSSDDLDGFCFLVLKRGVEGISRGFAGRFGMTDKPTQKQVEQRRDEAVRRALNTPPEQHQDLKKRKQKEREADRPTASEKRT